MTTHLSKPFIHVSDSNGMPYVGAVLKVYDFGTTTLSSIYSDEALSVAITNPLTGVNASDASGNFQRIYAAAGKYKIRAETSTGTLIWEYDNIDIGLGFGGGPLAIASGGTGATSAAAALTALGAASASSVTALSSDIANILATLQNIVTAPQGYLTLVTGTPVFGSNQTAKTSVFYTPFLGNLVPIYDGTQFNIYEFAELTLTLAASHTANTLFDVFVFLDTSTVTIGTGPAWTTSTAGSGARGTGAGTTEIGRTNGLWTNSNSMTARNGATTYTVDANEGTYIGTIYMDGTNGQISCYTDWSGNSKWGVWNAYNRRNIEIRGGEATASWTYAVNTLRQSNGAANADLTILCGLSEERVYVEHFQEITAPASTTVDAKIGIGWNSTSASSGTVAQFASGTVNAQTFTLFMTAKYSAPPFIGVNVANALERGTTATTTFFGNEAGQVLSARWMG